MTAPGGPAVPGNAWDTVAAPPPTSTRVGVVVTHFEQPRQLRRTLAALAGQTHPAGLMDVVVADDGSERSPHVPAGVRLVRQPHRGFGAARARNRGAGAVTGDVLVFLDADTTPEPDFVARMVARPAVLPEAVVVGRRRHADLPVGGAVRTTGPMHELPEPAWLRDAYRRTRDLRDADETSFRFVISAVLACTRWMLEETGGFDESFDAYGGEDWEWAHRAWNHGALLAHEPLAVAWHDGPARHPPEPADVDERARLLAETMSIAARIPVPGVSPRGLLTPGAADPLVTLAPSLVGDALVLTVDSLLAALPRSAVLVPPEVRRDLPTDPRLVPTTASHLDVPTARSPWRRLHVERPVNGDGRAWTACGELLQGPGAAGRVSVVVDGEVALRWSSLRAERRERRWDGARLFRDSMVDGHGLRAIDGAVTAQARWGEWA